MNVIIVDDDDKSSKLLEKQLETFSCIHVKNRVQDSLGLTECLQSEGTDLVFLDINLANTSGLDLATHLKHYYPDVMVIFVTGHAEYALEGYEVHPIDFLTKPVDPLRLEKAIVEAKKHKWELPNINDTKIGIRTGGSLKLVRVEDILYIEKKGRKSTLQLSTKESIESSDSLQNLEIILEPYHFYRPHQSYLVPLEKVEEVNPDDFMRSYGISLKGTKEKIPLSKSKYSELKNQLSKIGMILR